VNNIVNRYWVSWWSGNYADEGCVAPPFQFWNSGERIREDSDRTDCSLCAVIDAPSEVEIRKAIKKYFPDFELRFCDLKKLDFVPSGRFTNFQNKTGVSD
jgi:hypothetical protein